MRDEFWLEDQSPDLFDIEDDQTPDSFGAFSNVLRGPEGPPGPPGPRGEPGADGTVSFDELTPAQKESLRGEGVPAGGTTGQVLAKSSNADYATRWVDAGGSASLTILSYGHSTWADFIAAYNSRSIVYCRASSDSDPASGSQTRLAFMAYVNSAASPTSVEFQYYRSVSSHTDDQQGDQVYIYKLTSAGAWTVTVRDAFTKIVAGTNMSSSYANGTLTLNATGGGSNMPGIEYIVGTQTAATAAWTGASVDETLQAGKVIAYLLPFAGTSTAATLTLTMAGGSMTEAIPLRRTVTSTVTTQFAAGSVLVLIYDGTYWQVSAYYDSNTVPTGYCTTAAGTATKTATCNYGYRGDTNYFPCVFRYANTAANATLAISSYATTALPIYVNGERTSSTNTFSAGVILFLFYNDAYYCYNDGRFPILVDGVVTSVQEYAASKSYADNIVSVSDTQPTATENKLWVDTDASSGTSYQVPTVAEMEAADNTILGNLASKIGVISETPIISGDDLNNYTQSGYYRTGGTLPTNAPSGTTWAILQVLTVGTTRIQIIYKSDYMYMRTGNSTTWYNWYRYAGTQV